MKKPISLIGILLITSLFIGWQTSAFSKSKLPYPDIPVGNNPSQCVQTTANEIVKYRDAWNENLNSTLAQEKPTSDMVDEAFEGMRTYRCWLDYLCQAVLLSGTIGKEQAETEKKNGYPFALHLNTLPGCVEAKDITIPSTELKYMPYCQADPNTVSLFADADANFRQCQALVGIEFGGSENSGGVLKPEDIKKFQDSSSAFIGLESALKTKSAAQKSRILQQKLNSITSKLQDTEGHLSTLYQHITRFDQKLPCYAAKCD